jgi:type VI secretion system secreted protein VgrG
MATTQADRDYSVSSPLGDDVLLLESFSGTEAVSSLFELDAVMVSDQEKSVNSDALVGKKMTLNVTLADGSKRHLNGYVRQFAQMTGHEGQTKYRAKLVPWLWFLTQQTSCRIFQNKTTPEIIKQIFADRGFAGDVEDQLQGNFEPREFCIQFRETDLDFVSRLMAEEGIFYFFKHSDGSHKLVLANKPSAHEALPSQSSARFHRGKAGLDVDVVQSFRREQQFSTGKVSYSAYHFLMPSNNLEVSAPTVAKVADNSKYELYDYRSNYVQSWFDEGDTGKVRQHGEKLAKLHMESIEAQHVSLQGTSNCKAFIPGYKFTLEEHPDDKLNGDYVLTSVQFEATSNLPGTGEATFANSFTAIPADTPFRPVPLDKPNVEGLQTAVVVGRKGEEIDTDKYGRVKIQFHWDREGKDDQDSSCWVRVSQLWAHKNWGAHFWPRIDDEVLVGFLGGDPDQPIIVGSLYNAENMPPYKMPDKQTQSGIKSRSTKNGSEENFNEIRFEDKKDEEEIYIHAERDFNRVVENDDTLKVGFEKKDKGDQTIEIHNNQTLKIGNPQASDGSQTVEIWKNRDVNVKTGNDTLKIELGKSSTEAMQSIELKVGGNSITIDQTGITLKGIMIDITGQAKASISAPMTEVTGYAALSATGGIVKIN